MTPVAARAARPTVVLAVLLTMGCATAGQSSRPRAASREDVLARAQVSTPIDASRVDLRRGPAGRGAFSPDAVVDCRYVPRKMGGNTPKFTCVRAGGDELKVKYGADNGEVFAEVAATRLFWALGFGADRMYPVRIRCRECPAVPGGEPRKGHVERYDVAAVERQFSGRDFEGPGGSGWAWNELDRVSPSRGGASLAERDALRLLAALLQHSDSKDEQQRLVCLDGTDACRKPFMLVSDLGRTFGRASALNSDTPSSVNLPAWKGTPVWVDDRGCRANLDGSLTGTLSTPVISEGGRLLLLQRLRRLSDRQLRDLFAVSRFPLRARTAGRQESVDDWVAAFRDKVAQVERRSCLPSQAAR